MTKRKFYRTVITLEVLSEEPDVGTLDLDSILYEITSGGCSGQVIGNTEEELNGETTAQLLMKQGSDPGFFQLDEDGNDAEDEVPY